LLGVRSRIALDVYQADRTVEELFPDNDMCVRRGRRGWKSSSPYFCFVIIVGGWLCGNNVVVMSVESLPTPVCLVVFFSFHYCENEQAQPEHSHIALEEQ
jgi:hypothetical protein